MSFNQFSSEIKPKTDAAAGDKPKAAPEKSAKEPDQTKTETAQTPES